MAKRRKLEQHIAVFGQTGSGKTVLLSSFYGGAQDPRHGQGLYSVVAEDTTQGDRLLKNYFGMENSGQVPPANRFRAEPYRFSVSLTHPPDAATKRSMPFEAMQVVWHDYPGEWFERSVSGAEEERRRIEAFRELLVSDIAVVLVDGQKIAENAGEEERYLKELFHSLRTGLLRLREDLLEDGRPLVQFPRIWILALSKADLLPEMTVDRFRALLIEKAAEEVGQLREAIESLVAGDEALAVGEDFLLLSSARFAPGAIDVSTRVGVDLLLPLAAVLPFERHVRWARRKEIPGKVAQELLGRADELRAGAMALAMLGSRKKLPGRLGIAATALATAVNLVPKSAIDDAASLAGEKLAAVNARALAAKENVTAILTGFKLDLERAEKDRVLLRSRR